MTREATTIPAVDERPAALDGPGTPDWDLLVDELELLSETDPHACVSRSVGALELARALGDEDAEMRLSCHAAYAHHVLADDASALAAAARTETLAQQRSDLVWQSRSGPPRVPWLAPDIVDHIDALHGNGVRAAVVSPVGFMSDHFEVVWDLDHEARLEAEKLGMAFARAATPSTDRRFAELIVELVREHTAGAPARKLSSFPVAGCTANGAFCVPGCCEPPRRPTRRPARLATRARR